MVRKTFTGWFPRAGRRRSKAPDPPATYRWSVHYYAAHNPDKARVHWQVRIKHAGEAKIVEGFLSAPGEWSQVYTLKVQPPREPEPASPTDALNKE